jgi:hypothetical protein
MPITEHPLTEPDERYYRIRLLPWVKRVAVATDTDDRYEDRATKCAPDDTVAPTIVNPIIQTSKMAWLR